MGFWESKLNQMRPPEPQQRPNVAPGAWWQERPVAQQPRTQPRQQIQRTLPEPADTCPRCGSDAFVEFYLDVSEGGAIDPRVGSKRKQCFDCRYPHYNASGNIASGKGAAAMRANGAKIQNIKARSMNIGRTESEIFGTAMNIDGAV